MLRLAGPVVVARAGIMTMALVDTIMVGRFSSQELAYQGIGLAPVSTLLGTAIGLLLGTAVVTANALGRDELTACGAAWRRAVPYAAVLGLVSAAICAAGEPLLLATGQSADLAAGGGEVLLVIGIGLPFAFIYIATAFFLEAIKRPRAGMIAMIAANVINIGLNWVLVWGHFGLPAMGAVGSAWATTIIRLFLAVVLVAFVWWLPDRDRYGIRVRAAGGWSAWSLQRRIGYASGASIGVEGAAFTALSLIAGTLGTVAVGAFSIVLNMLAMAFMVAIGIGAATGVRVAIADGRHDYPDLALAGWTGLAVNTAAMLALGVVFLAVPGILVAAYSSDPAVIAAAVPLVMISSAVLVFDGGQGVVANALRGRGDTWIPTGLHVISYFVVMVPVSWLLAYPLGRGVIGLYEGILIGSIVSALVLSGRFHGLARRDRRREGGP